MLVVAIWLIACGSQAPEPVPLEEPRPPVEAQARVDRAVATTGDILTYTVSVDYDPAYEISFPEAGAEIAGFRIVDIGSEPPREVRGRRIEERWYKLRADLVGSYVLPPVTVAYRQRSEADAGEVELEIAPADDEPAEESAEPSPYQTVETSEIFVEVESVLAADGEATDIRGLKPLRQIERPWPWWWFAAGGGAVVLLGVLALLLWPRRRKDAAAPPRPAHVIAFEALERLRHTDFDDVEAMRLFHFEISEVIRTYVENRFGLNATDLTTEEIVDHLDEVRGLGGDDSDTLRDFLDATDQVKFAAFVPSQDEIRATYERALGFVESTRERPLEVEASAERNDGGASRPPTEEALAA